VAYIGSSRVASGGPFRQLQNKFYELVFEDSVTSVGEALALSKLPFIGEATSETTARWLEFAITLLGDPELPVWRRGPAEIFANHSSTYLLGAGSYSVVVNVAGSPLDSARVALVKSVAPGGPIEEFAVGWTGANGTPTCRSTCLDRHLRDHGHSPRLRGQGVGVTATSTASPSWCRTALAERRRCRRAPATATGSRTPGSGWSSGCGCGTRAGRRRRG
jgi:hypothetical protein